MAVDQAPCGRKRTVVADARRVQEVQTLEEVTLTNQKNKDNDVLKWKSAVSVSDQSWASCSELGIPIFWPEPEEYSESPIVLIPASPPPVLVMCPT